MSNKHSPGKITLGMMKGKPITTSVPVIHYRADNDELEELYPSSSDDEKCLTPEFEKAKLPSSPSRNSENENQGMENESERRSVDSNLSEGTPPSSDPWKMLSEIKGKITKTFEEKLSEIKNDKKKKRGNKDNSSFSDSEDPGDVTPTDEIVNEKQEKELARHKSNTSRFVGFSQVRTGLKTKNSQDDSVESGVEASEFSEPVPEPLLFELQDDSRAEDKTNDLANRHNFYGHSDNLVRTKKEIPFSSLLSRLKDYVLQQLTKQLAALLVLIFAFCFLIPLPAHLVGFFIGVFVTMAVYKLMHKIKEILATPLDEKLAHTVIPVLEIPAAEEHAVQERYEGWLNELPYTYDPHNYHVARTKSVYFSLEGSTLRVTETRMRVPKRTVWDEPKRKFKFTRKRVYNIVGAKVELLPEGLIRRRRWSKKYPICITIDRGQLIDNSMLSDWTDLGKESFDDEKKNGQEGDESTLGEETKSEDEDSRLELFRDNEEEESKVEEDDDDDDISQSKSLKSIYEDCRDDEEMIKYKLYVFARADREKEDWFRRLTSAASLSKKRQSTCSINDSVSCANATSVQSDVAETKSLETLPEITYNTYMNKYLNVNNTTDTESTPKENDDVLWVNCLLGRLVFDMHSCRETINLIQDKIQRKLSNIKLPYFMESLSVTEIVIGQDAPTIDKVTKPIFDERGLWLDLNITYKGCLTMTVETKLNLMKLTRASSVSGEILEEKSIPTRSPIFDSDVEDSPETSTEDEDVGNVASYVTSPKDTTLVQSSGKKFLNMVDKLTANKYFRHATELSYVRRAMEGVSNTEIKLMVNVSGIEGCLSVNIPPPPSDRLWYGFKPVPKINLTVQPALGERTVNIVYVTKWIENKLLREFEKLVVLPNMDDLVLPFCPNYPFVTT
ncbi:testis-expressed protein 2 [Pseudomyrmex gracilis]|uniref:testis-expressed protein 2 n=1 Tax=Pseudomyrmex gracilis TaxID=219809 RepID=UPI0009955250|nr:testis-expressed protein 2 [Pseudomyrmex gracilis]